MAKFIKKLVAWIMVLSICVGTLVLPAAADESEGSTTITTTTADITDGSGNVIGTITTKTETNTSENSKTYSEVTDTNSSWNSQQTETGSTGTADNGTTVSVVTDVTGSETATDSISTNKNTGVQTYSGSASGSEDTTITDTTTTVTTTNSDLQSSSTTTSTSEDTTSGEWSEYEQVGEDGQWVADPDNDTTTGYQQVEGSGNTTSGTSGIDVDKDPLDDNDVSLNLTPNGSASVTLNISIEDALKNDIAYENEGKQADGSVVTFQRDADGNVIGYTVTTYSNYNYGTEGSIQAGTSGKPQNSGEPVKTYIKPEGYTPVEKEPILDDNGKEIGYKTVVEKYDEEGNVIGYEITTEIIENVPTTSKPSTEEGETPEPGTVVTLPERPVAPAPSTDKYGFVTTVTVEDIIEDGEVVGYKTITVVTDEDGNQVSTSSESIFATVTTYGSTVQKTPETDVITTTTTTTVYGTLLTQNATVTTPGTSVTVNYRDVTEEVYQLVETEDGLYFLYQGQMYEVLANDGHGTVTMNGLQPNIDALEPGNSDYKVNGETHLRNPEDFTVPKDMSGIKDGLMFDYLGYGLESTIMVNKNYEIYGEGYSGNQVRVHQFKLVDEDGNAHYVLCADLGTSAIRGADYNMVNVEDAEYFGDDAAKMIQAIALSGYWGTNSGVGSLDAVKQFLRENSDLTEKQINALTPGEALTATQAAIWYYGTSNDSQNMHDEAITGVVYTGQYSYRDANGTEATLVNTLYQLLINMDPDSVENNTTEFITEDNFAEEVKLTIKEKATDSDGSVKVDSNSGNEKYVTDLTFSLDVKKSDITGNLKITVVDQYGNTLAERQLATDDSNFLGQLLAEDTAGSGTYTIKDLEIAEGVTVSLNLSGTQNLNQGVYLYTAEVYSDSQTFVGIASGERTVDLSVNMKFSVTDPQAQVKNTTNTWTEEETVTKAYTKTDNYAQYQEGTESSETVVVTTEVYGTTVKTDVTTKTTDKHRDWEYEYKYKLKPIDGDDEFYNIPDEEVPLANAPKTGDISLIWVILSGLSAGGLVLLRKRED